MVFKAAFENVLQKVCKETSRIKIKVAPWFGVLPSYILEYY